MADSSLTVYRATPLSISTIFPSATPTPDYPALPQPSADDVSPSLQTGLTVAGFLGFFLIVLIFFIYTAHQGAKKRKKRRGNEAQIARNSAQAARDARFDVELQIMFHGNPPGSPADGVHSDPRGQNHREGDMSGGDGRAAASHEEGNDRGASNPRGEPSAPPEVRTSSVRRTSGNTRVQGDAHEAGRIGRAQSVLSVDSLPRYEVDVPPPAYFRTPRMRGIVRRQSYG